MLSLIRFIGIISCIGVLVVMVKILFVHAPATALDETSPGLLVQSWNETPCGTLIGVVALVVLAVGTSKGGTNE
jgi:hypothetical protein